MITETRRRRYPVRACDVRKALATLDAAERPGHPMFGPLDLAEGEHPVEGPLVGAHAYEIRQDRLACEVRHRVQLRSGVKARLWWMSVGRPLYDSYIEDVFDALARATGASVRRPTAWAPYSRLARRVLMPARPEPRVVIATTPENRGAVFAA
ncbi:hypothetical protein [Cumulibacter soli]|uniref:hypothetical protein n=1 Tax=Cumulibacter soli TaxID=2546344 RepID=UPI001068B1B4|nr:hypothetical protein [Cumulibacter soli]